ncbi:MAG: DegT/DnrJ/EryC1/StrS family aminotransferase, partial [Ignavibacteriaceae bacterium]
VMPVHLYGYACEMDEIKKIANEHNLMIIEDCAEAFGTKYKNKHVGNFGSASTFSFFGNKTITTGEGGMVVMNNKKLFEHAVHLKGQGLANNREYWHDIIGYNYRMTNICAAIGLAQLERADKLINNKRKIAKWYDSFLEPLPVITQEEKKNIFHSYWMYNILVEKSKLRDKLREHLKKHGIETRPMFFPLHTMTMYYNKNVRLPVAEDIAGRGINLPSYPDLTKSDIEYISSKIRDFFN